MNKPVTPPGDALAGLRVLDFSIMLAGPYCARLLADMGADVIKVETLEGDDMRLRTPLRKGHGTYFGQLNAGKRSLTLDLKNPEAIALVHRLAKEVDVVVENFRPGVMDRLGIGSEVLRAINPRLVFCSISGYGQTGEAAERPAYAMIVHADSGFDNALMRYAGDRARPASGAVFVADVMGGIYAYSAIQTALVQRARTGLGQTVDVALMDCMLNLLIYELQEAQFPIETPRPTYGPVRASDGDLLIAPITARNFDALCKVTQLAALRDDPRFKTIPQRGANWSAMMGVIEQWTQEHSVARCIEQLEAGGVPCSAYREPGDTLSDPHLRARGLFSQLTDGAGAFTGVNPPWQMSATRSHVREKVPSVGEHTDAVLSDLLGVKGHELQALRRAGVFGAISKVG